jgi:plastocyanin
MIALEDTSMNLSKNCLIAAIVALGLFAGMASAASAAPVSLTLKDHRFSPAELSVPAGQRVQVLLVNQDPATEEFDSHDLKVEKLVTPNSKASFWIGPLAPGAYKFMGEFHPATAQGRVVVK